MMGSDTAEGRRSLTNPGLLTFGALASLAAGAIHATAAGMHSEHQQAVWAFVGVAAFQIGWGVVALLRSGRLLSVVGAVGNAAAFSGWVMAKSSGIGFVDGLEESESIQFADGVAAALAATAVLVSLAPIILVVITHRAARIVKARTPRLAAVGAVVAVGLAVPGMVSAGSHSHAGGHADGHGDHAEGSDGGDGHDHAGAVPPEPFDPTKPIDLGGVPGVSAEEQARAENLLAANLLMLPKWADTATAEAAGYRSIGDSLTGEEHYINWSLINDDKILDPSAPESLVYRVNPADDSRTLEAAMYMLPFGSTWEDVPELGGELTQFHVHDDLCFTNDVEAPQVVGVTTDGECIAPNVKFDPTPMIHVWIRHHPCGPFAALSGVGAGQIEEGEERLCDHAHGGSL